MKLSTTDYKKILKFYKLSIPKKTENIKKKADKIIAKKFCSCIKKVQQKFKKEGIAIGICTKSVITRKGYKRGKFKCKKRRTIKLQKGGRRKTRKKRGGTANLCKLFFDDNGGDIPIDTSQAELDELDKYCKNHGDTNIEKNDDNKCQASTGNCWLPTSIQPRRLLRVNRQGNNQGSRRSSIASTSLAPGRLTRQGGKRRRSTRKKRGGMKKAKTDTSIEAVRERLKKAALNIDKTRKNIQSSTYKQKLRTSPIIHLKKGPLTKEEEALQNEMNRVSPIDSNLIYKPLMKFTKKPVKIESKKSKGGKRRRRTRKKK